MKIKEPELSQNKKIQRNSFYKFIPELAALSVLLISGFVYIYSIDSFLDILDYDDSTYLQWGVSFPSGFPVPEWSPVYVLWFYFLSFFRPDTIQLYYLNYILVTVLPPLFIYVFLRVSKIDLTISFTFSLLFLLSFANFPTSPKVSFFALMILLLGLIVSAIVKDVKLKTLVLTFTVLINSFIRPEFFISFLLLSLILLYLYLKEFYKSKNFKLFIPLITVAVTCFVFIHFLGVPVGSGDRSFIAFGQHYSCNWVKWHNDSREPYANFRIIMNEDFGNSASLEEVVFKNPAAVAKHMLENLLNIPNEIRYMFLSFYPSSYPVKELTASALFILLYFFISVYRNKYKLDLRTVIKNVLENFKSLKFFYLLIFISLLPFIFSGIFIFPRRHYLIFPGLIVLLMLIILFFRNVLIFRKRFFTGMIYVCILSLLLVRPLKSLLELPTPENLTAIKYLRNMDITEPVYILDDLGIYSIYESKNYSRVGEYIKDDLFNTYRTKWSINLIVLSDRLLKDTRFSEDPEWIYFINNVEEFGFVKIDVPGADKIKLLIKKEILNNQKL